MVNFTTRFPTAVLARVQRLTTILSIGAPKGLQEGDTIRLLVTEGLAVVEPANGIRPPPEAA